MHTASCSYNAARSEPQNESAKREKAPPENRLAAYKPDHKLFISAEAHQALAQFKGSADAERSDTNLNTADGHGLDDDDHLHGIHGDEHHDDDNETDTSKQLNNKELSRKEPQEVRELQLKDRQVRAHEQAHVAASGRVAVSSSHYEFETGPDDRQYAVGDSVNYNMPASGSAGNSAEGQD